MLSETYYAQNYAGIIGVGLTWSINIIGSYNMIFRGWHLNTLILNDNCITQCTFG